MACSACSTCSSGRGSIRAQRRTVSTIRDSGKALLHIIDEVLDFSKIEAGRLDLEATPFLLSNLVDAVVDTFRPQALAKRSPSLRKSTPAHTTLWSGIRPAFGKSCSTC